MRNLFVDLDQIAEETEILLENTRSRLQEHQLQVQRDEAIKEALNDLENRLLPLIEKLEAAICQFEPVPEDIARKKLIAKRDQLIEMLQNAPIIAVQTADNKLLKQEEALLNEQINADLERWRFNLKEDLLESIRDQQDFYKATDLAIAIKGYAKDLIAINALDEVIQTLINQINQYDRLKDREEGVARFRGSAEQTLNFIADIAQRNRGNCQQPHIAQPRTRNRSSSEKPSRYKDLAGNVIVFGGHENLEQFAKERLKESQVILTWCPVDSGMGAVSQVEQKIPRADLIVIMTAYSNHTLTTHASQAIKRSGKEAVFHHQTGIIRFLEFIELNLKSRALAQQLGKRSA